jgi:hypothetical protein
MSTVIDLIERIKSRPTMYIGERSVDCLRAFLDGWLMARDPNRQDSEFMLGFQEWIQRRYRVETSQSWARIIAFYSPDQPAALDQALNLLTEYSSIGGPETRGTMPETGNGAESRAATPLGPQHAPLSR